MLINIFRLVKIIFRFNFNVIAQRTEVTKCCLANQSSAKKAVYTLKKGQRRYNIQWICINIYMNSKNSQNKVIIKVKI